MHGVVHIFRAWSRVVGLAEARPAVPSKSPCKPLAGCQCPFQVLTPDHACAYPPMSSHPTPTPTPLSRALRWLRKELAAAEHAGEKVVVAAHHPIGAGSGRPTHMAWNWAQVQEVLVGSK